MSDSQQQPRIPRTIGEYTFRAVLGSGSYSEVRLAYNNSTRVYYACKIIRRSSIDNNEERRKRFEEEIRVMQKAKYPGIVDLVDLIKDENFYFVFLEYCANGELFDYIVNNRRIPENEAKKLIKQIILSVQYIHSLGIAHRDLKPENILMDGFGNVKIADFGFSKIFDETNTLTSTICGTLLYLSPDVISGLPYDAFKSDVWSIGVILYAMVTGSSPWNADSDSQKMKLIKNGQYSTPSFLSDQCRDLISSLMCVDPKKRITLKEALEHKWIKMTELPTQVNSYCKTTISLKYIDQFFNPMMNIESAPLTPQMSDESMSLAMAKQTVNCISSEMAPNVVVVTAPANKADKNFVAKQKKPICDLRHKPNPKDSIRRKVLISRPTTVCGFQLNRNNGNGMKANFNQTNRKITFA